MREADAGTPDGAEIRQAAVIPLAEESEQPGQSEQSEQASTDRSRIVSAAAIIMVGTVLSRLLGLGREQITAYFFGAGNTVAAWTIADNVNTLIFSLVMSGMMEAALVPVLSAYAERHSREEYGRVLGGLLMLTFLIVGALVAIGEFFTPIVVTVMTGLGGDSQAHGEAAILLTRQLVQLVLPSVLLLALSTVLMAALYSLHRYTLPALSLAARNAFAFGITLALGWTIFGIRSLAVGVVIGTLAMIVIQLPGLRDVHIRLNVNFRHPAIKQILALYLPIAVGLISNMVALIIDRNLAWGIGEYALAAMRYGTTLNQLVLGIVATATSVAALPTLSRHFANRDELAFQRVLSNGLKMVTIMVVPATFGLAAIAWPTVDLVFFHGATTQGGAHATLIALLAYLPGTFFAAFDQVLIFAYYARHNTRTPVIVGVLAVGVYLIFALTLIQPFGMAGLVLANSAQFVFHGLVMWWLVHRLLGHAGDHTVARTLKVSLLVGAAMAGIVFVLAKGLEMASLGPLTSIDLVHRLIVVAVPVAIGAVIYLGGLHLFGVDEVGMLTRGVKRRLRPRPGVSS